MGGLSPNFTFNTPWRNGQDFHEAIKDQDAVCVFLRYHGCPVCQMEMANFKRDIELFSEQGAKVFIVIQSSVKTLQPLLIENDWPLEIIADPEGKIFQLYGVEPCGVLQYLHPSGLVSLIKALSKGFMHKKFEGKETQLPAAFIIKSDQVVNYAYYGKTISDVPTPAALAEQLAK